MKQYGGDTMITEQRRSTRAQLIEDTLEKLIPVAQTPYMELYTAAKYSLQGPAKRIRPLLTLAVVEIFGESVEKAASAACALELIHTYSLIHDDLPCMDDDDFRRGKPSLHKTFPEGHAVLTGDFLLTYAFEVISNDEFLSAQKKVALIQKLAKAAGGEGMIAGQLMDLQAEGQEIDLERLKLIHTKKTGALLTAAVEFGGILGNATVTEMKHLHDFGLSIGLAFQVVDDILDVTESFKKHGKAVSSDTINKKFTYVNFMGLEKSQEFACKLHNEALNSLKQLPYDSSQLKHLADMIVHRTE